MATENIAHPPIATAEEWLIERKKLLACEKELTREYDRVNAQRRRLPMVRVDKEYVFDGPEGKRSLKELFDGRRQLIVYHFMFDPAWDEGCPGCTSYVDAIGDLSSLPKRDTSLVLVSRAPLAKLETYKAAKGWSLPWYSSFGSDFNYDFHATLDDKIVPYFYNYKTLEEAGPGDHTGEASALSVFFRLDDDIFHTYSTFARGGESLVHSYALLDVTPYGRQEDFEDSPPGWPQKPTYG